MAIALPWVLGIMVDQVFVLKKIELLKLFALGYALLSLLRAGFYYMQTYLLAWLGQYVLHDIRQDLFLKYEQYPISEFNRIPSGRLVTRLMNDTSSLQDLFSAGIAVAFAELMTIFGIILWMIVLNPKLGLICVSVFPLMLWVSNVSGKKLRDNFRETRSALSRMNAFIAENINGMWLIQIFNRQKDFKKKFNRVNSKYTNHTLKTVQIFSYFQPLITLISSLSISLLIWFGGYGIIEKNFLGTTITLGLLVAFISYLQALYTPIRSLTEKYNLFVAAMASCEKIFEFMDRPIERDEGSRPIQLPVKGEIEFRNLNYSYLKNKPVLKNINFKINASEKIGIVGHTGAGKSTLTSLILKFYKPDSGVITIDGQDIHSLNRQSLRSVIGYIQQDPFIFSGTIADNIFLWDEKCRERYEELPLMIREPFMDGRLNLNQEVYEKGANLSVGEKQMVAFLRAIVRNPSILILDEATAHIDLVTEKWVENASMLAFKGKTVLIVAHRLSTLRNVDRLFVFQQGELIESGTHSELLQKQGYYEKYYTIQVRKEKLLKPDITTGHS